MKRFTILFILMMLVAAPNLVWGQTGELSESQQQRLVSLIEDGKNAYDSGEFETSLSKFRQAYDLYQHPDIVYRIALCYERLGEDQEAVKHYRQFLAQAPDAPERQRIEKTIEVIEARIAKSEIRITTDPTNAEIFIDDEANGTAGYTPTALAVKPGNYTLIVKKSGYEPVRELVTVKGGQSLQVRYQLAPLDGSTPPPVTRDNPPSSRGGSGMTVGVLTLTTIGIASGITSFVFFRLHSDKVDEVQRFDKERAETSPNEPVPVSRSEYERAENQRDVNLAVAISTAAISVGSLLWAYGLFTADRSRARAASLGIGWNDGPHVSYGVTF